MSGLLNRGMMRATLLDIAADERFHSWTRISSDWEPYLIARIMAIMRSDIRAAPTKGKTLYPPVRVGGGDQ